MFIVENRHRCLFEVEGRGADNAHIRTSEKEIQMQALKKTKWAPANQGWRIKENWLKTTTNYQL